MSEELKPHYPLFDDGLYTEVVHQSGEKGVRILKGKYKGVIFQYGNVKLVPIEEEEVPTIDFERAVRSCPDEFIETISEDEQFNDLMRDILIELLANEGIKEFNYGIQQRIQSKTEGRNNS